MKLSHDFDFSKYKTLCDVGGSGANLSMHIAKNNSHMQCTSFDLPAVAPIAKENVFKKKAPNYIAIIGALSLTKKPKTKLFKRFLKPLFFYLLISYFFLLMNPSIKSMTLLYFKMYRLYFL
ncbi:methyltransferase [Mariniflexile sp. AS56]|uniref:methyltransferase n=1 Tax=Mariniflexile sp. AS56 TaxID=3063957 RepID=UPI0034E97479